MSSSSSSSSSSSTSSSSSLGSFPSLLAVEETKTVMEGEQVELSWVYFTQSNDSQLTLLRLHSNGTTELISNTTSQTKGPFTFFRNPTICDKGTSFSDPRSLSIANVTHNLSGRYRLTDGNRTSDIILIGL